MSWWGVMVTSTGVSPGARRSVDDHSREAYPEGATRTWSTGPDLLAEAAVVLPTVVGRGQVRWVDIHAAIYRAACTRGMGRDRPHRLRLADEALDMFTEALLRAGLARPRKHPMLGWLACADLMDARLALASAAGYCRRELQPWSAGRVRTSGS